jgi:uncharacterized protein (TIRG00374 family)
LLRSKRLWFGLVIGLGFLALFIYDTDFSEIKTAFQEANYALALASIPLYFVGFWVRTMRWRILLRPVRDVSTRRLYPVVLVGLTANNVIPARIGELVRAILVGQRESASKSAVLGTIAVDRVFDGLTLVAILSLVTAISGTDRSVTGIGIGTAILFAAAAAVLVGLAFSPTHGKRLLFKLAERLPARLAPRVQDLVESFLQGLDALRSPMVLLEAAVLSLGSWLLEACMYYVVGQAFHLEVGFHVYLLIAAAANLALSVLASPGGVGPFEATTKNVLNLFIANDPAKAVAYTIALHALLLIPVTIVGFILLYRMEFSLSDLLGIERPAPVQPAPAPQRAE